MKNLRFRSISLAMSAFVAIGLASSSQAVVVSITGAQLSTDQVLIDFINNNFSNVTQINYGYYTTAAAVPAGTDVLLTGRRVFSGDFGNAANSAAFNALTIPVVGLTAYVTRPNGDRWGWTAGGTAGTNVVGNETTVTSAGSVVFGPEGAYDWWGTLAGTQLDTFNAATAAGGVGQGDVLATINGFILSAGWDAGELLQNGQAAGGSRLLFNLPDLDGAGAAGLPNTAAGQLAFRNALEAYTPLVAIPEPSSVALLMGALGFMGLLRRRSA